MVTLGLHRRDDRETSIAAAERIKPTCASRRRRWWLKKTDLFVTQCRPLFAGLRILFYATRGLTEILGTHRTRRAAMRTCERANRREQVGVS